MVYVGGLIVKKKWQLAVSDQRSAVSTQKKDLLFTWMYSTIHIILIYIETGYSFRP